MMTRRDAVARVALLMGGTLIGAEAFLAGCGPATHDEKQAGTTSANANAAAAPPKDLLNPEQTAYLTEVAGVILPPTKTPGAKAANVGPFMAVMVRDCYTPEDQQIFLKGMTQLEDACKQQNGGKGFLACTPEQQTALLKKLDAEQQQYTKTKTLEQPNHYFRMMKGLAVLGFFTSEIGATQALRYLPVPGKYVGDYPYKKGDRAWATS